MTDITGRTRLFGILADPIHHVRAPQAINARFARHGHDAVLVPMHVTAAALPAIVDALRRIENFDGCVVTMPHKSAIVPLLDTVTDDARAVGAVNIVRRDADGSLHGQILDGEGFVAGLRAAGIDPAGRSVYLAGAGGAANAIVFSLARAGVARIAIANRSIDKAQALAQRVAAAFPGVATGTAGPDPSGFDLVVNSTSLGMQPGDALPLDVSKLDPAQTVAEIIMQPAETPLLAAATARGCRVQPGAPMLDAQVDLMVAWMTAGRVGS
jgi:shikimate dehydrogenase